MLRKLYDWVLEKAAHRKADWSRWFDPRIPARELLKPLAAGSLAVEQVN